MSEADFLGCIEVVLWTICAVLAMLGIGCLVGSMIRAGGKDGADRR